MPKGHFSKFLSFFLFLCLSIFCTTQHASASTAVLANTTPVYNNFSEIPAGKENLYFNNNIMFYEWCPDGGDGSDLVCNTASGSQITWIGDSYSERSENKTAVEEKYPGIYYNGKSGRKFKSDDSTFGASGLNILKNEVKNSLRDFLVFALGTNADASTKEAMANNIKDLVDTAKQYNSNTKIILVSPLTNNDGARKTYDAYYEAMKEAAEKYDNVILADWYAAAKDHLDEYFDDHSTGAYTANSTHPNSKGYDVWLETIYNAIPGSCGGIITSGDTAGEKIWSGFARLGYTDNQIAGIIGNIANEGGMSPARWEDAYKGSWGTPLRTLGSNTGNSIGMGLTGFTYYKHLINLADAMDAKAPDLMHYLESDAKTYGSLSGDALINKLKEEKGTAEGDLIANRLFSVQVQYIHDTIQHDYESSGVKYTYPDFDYSGLKSVQGDACAVSNWWLENYEKPKYYNYDVRCNSAREYYNKFHGKTFGNASSSSQVNQNTSSSSSSSSKSKSTSKSNSSKSSTANSNNGTTSYDAILHAKNADKQATDFPGVAAWNDLSTDSMKKLLETYGDLAYQLDQVVKAPYVAVLVQMRYEDADSKCGKNNFWGNGCSGSNAYVGGSKIQGKNLGEGFVQYGQTLSESQYDYTRGITDPKKYLEAIGPMWVQGDRNGAGYGSIEGMKQSVDALQKFIDSPEGQAIVKTFGNYHENSSSSSGSGECGNKEKTCVTTTNKISETAVKLAWDSLPSNKKEGKKEFVEAFHKITAYSSTDNYTNCNQFAATVIITSGADPNFETGNTERQLEYVTKHKEIWQEVTWDGDESKLKPGDLLLQHDKSTHHAAIYVGNDGGSNGSIADASQDEHSGAIRQISSWYNNLRAFRLTNVADATNTSSGLGNSSQIVSKATELAHAENTKASDLKSATKAYSTAAKNAKTDSDKDDCAAFIKTVIVSSGADPDFPTTAYGDKSNDYAGDEAHLVAYMNSSDKWTKVDASSESDLQAGDILVSVDKHPGNNHIFIFLGDGKVASANQKSWYGRIGKLSDEWNPNGGGDKEFEYNGTKYQVFRLGQDDGCSINGGLTKEEAQKIADYYNSPAVSGSGLPYGKENCVSFSAWFVHYFTDISPDNVNPTRGNGLDVAGNLKIDYNLDGGDTPQAYSVFSNPTGVKVNGSSNHTGIIVGIEDDGTVITIEAAYGGWSGSSNGLARVWQYAMPPSGMAYTYLQSHLDGSKLNEVIK